MDKQKTLVAARVQLRQIMGDDNFRAYTRFVRHSLHPRMWNGERRTMGPGRFHQGAMSDYGALAEESNSMQND